MKPKYRRFTRSLPLIITIALGTPCITNAAIFNDDSAGNATPPPGTDPNTTIIADGPDLLVPAGNLVTIGSSINLNGQNDQLGVLVISGATPYTVNVLTGGSLSADSNQHAIISSTAITLSNNGTISGSNTSQGIQTLGGGSAITNNAGGLISGPNDAIRFTTDGGSVNNLVGGTINGTSGAASDGVQGLTDVNVTNNGSISGVNSGVRIDDNGFIHNDTNFNIFANPISGGSISGSDNGISAGNAVNVTNQNLSTITGTTEGIRAGEGAIISNELGGVITGTNGIGVRVLTGSSVFNSGTITGATGVEAALNGIFTLSNTGTITGTGGQAINGIAGVDTINLNPGSIINGNIVLGTGDDIVIMEANILSSNVVTGNIRGGPDSDTLTFTGGRTSPTSTENIVHGDVREMENIIKNGSDVALIGGVGELFAVQSDLIDIQSGGLYVNANVTAADGVSKATINAGGTALGGTGLWNADINITAGGFSVGAIPINLDVNPANSIGAVTITGDVNHSPGSFIRFDVAPGVISNGVNSDLILQTGVGNTYDIDGANIRIASTNNNLAIRNGVYTVVDSAEAITGIPTGVTVQFNPNVTSGDTGFVGTEVSPFAASPTNNSNTVLANFFTVASKSLDGTNLLLTVNHDFSSLALDPNAAAFGNAIDASTDSANALTQDFIAALDNSNLATVQATLSGGTPTSSFANSVAIASGNQRLNRLVQDHLAFTRTGGDSVRTYVGSYSQPAPEPMVQNSGVGNVWGTASFAWKDINTDTGGNFDGEEASFTAGVDYRVAPNLLLGILFDGSNGDYDFTGGSSDVDSFRAAIYGTYGQPTGIYADFLVGYGTHDSQLTRNAGLLGSVTGNPDADSIQAMITVGYAIQSGRVKHGPFGGLEYQKIDVDGYTQTGAFPIRVGSYDVDSLRLIAGYRAEADYGKFTPYTSVAYAHEFENDTLTATAIIPGGAGFGVTGSGLESAFLISLGTNYAFTSDLSLNVGYHGEISVGGDGADSHGASVGMNYAF
jgi:uncharacterized protein with beta-barrel porin domain